MPRHKYYDAIMAWAEGEAVQGRVINIGWAWIDYLTENKSPDFNDPDIEWRRKPKRFEEWRNVYRSGLNGAEYLGGLSSKSRAEAVESMDVPDWYVRTIRMVESDEQ